MLSRKVINEGIVFSVSLNNRDIHFREWEVTDDCIYYFPLATLVDNGNANFCKHECLVPFESLYLLDDSDRLILGLPPFYDKSIYVRGEGLLNSSDFLYKLELLTSVPDGEIIPFDRLGNILYCGEKKYLLSEIQYQLFNEIALFNSAPVEEKTPNYNLRCFSKIKQLAVNANCQLDSYLDNENVHIPEKIKLEVSKDESGFKIMPSIDFEENAKFVSTFDKVRKIQSVYPIQKNNGERIRVVLNEEQKKDLEPLKQRKCRFHDKDEIKTILNNPTEYFDPNQFDLSDFYSERVIEIGVYKPKFYPFISPYKSSWIAGATIETPENGTTKLEFKDLNTLENFEKKISDAEREGKANCTYNDALIDVKDARFVADIARKQLAKPDHPLKIESTSGHRVLLIEENASELGFSTDITNLNQESKYTLYPNLYLKKDFQLKQHQMEGVAWLQHLLIHKASGCLMADDMGLGKTLQILYFLDWHARTYPKHKPYLVVAPIALLENWDNEYRCFFATPALKVTKLTSANVPRKFNKQLIDELQTMDLILTNYESLRISQLNFCAVGFDVVVLDEAQKIKTPGTLVTNAAKALKSNFKIAMTGTPVENTLLDLWCIMDFCVPGLLGNAKSFAAKYQTPLKKDDTDLVALGKEIHNQLGYYFMRRLKSDVAKDLPPKIELKEQVNMPMVQESKYCSAIDNYEKGIQPNMLLTIMNIREISEHPYLYDSILEEYSSSELLNSSARLQATAKFMDRIKAKNEKVILFAERKQIQKMLQRIIRERYGIFASIINGDVPSIVIQNANKESRQQTIDRFQEFDGFNAIIMSPIAAGMGLNVTAANHVIHYSRHWNPAKENQATDRAYRIGQEKEVCVYYPMAISPNFRSFDVILDELLSKKASLATSTIFPTTRVEVKQDELSQMLFT